MKSSVIVRIAAVAAVASLGAVGCAKPQQPISTPSDTSSRGASSGKASDSPAAAVDRAVQENQGGSLAFSDEILKACPGIRAPQFGFDSSKLGKEWSDALSMLATCMNTGGLAGKSILLTGHTDPRGDDDYNLALGGRRAEAVKGAVAAFGVDGHRLDVTSRGKVDATGTDDAGWARDRRVDLDVEKPRVSTR